MPSPRWKALERHRGHFYNWYDTQSLKPLLPTYISTVDSGNLAGHLLTLRSGLLALPDHKILGPRVFDGLRDTADILIDASEGAALVSSIHSGMSWSRLASPGPPRWQRRAGVSTGWPRAPRKWPAVWMPPTTAKPHGGRRPSPGNAETPWMI